MEYDLEKLVSYGIDQSVKATWRGIIGDIYRETGQFFKSKEMYDKALDIVKGLEDHKNQEAFLLSNLGITYYLLHQESEQDKGIDQHDKDKYQEETLNNLKNAQSIYDKLWEELKTDEKRISFDDIHYAKTSRYLQSHTAMQKVMKTHC